MYDDSVPRPPAECFKEMYFRKVVIPAAIGDDVTHPPRSGAYRNALVVYEANNHKYLYSSDGEYVSIEQDDYDRLAHKPSINNVELNGNKTSADLGLASARGLADLSDHVDEIADELSISLEDEAGARTTEDERIVGLVNDLGDELNAEINTRRTSDESLQEQIDGITASSDVKDIVGTKAELDAYDKSTLGNNDIIKVISDSTHEDAMSYYRYDKATNAFIYIGKEGPFYTKSETDEAFVKKTDYAGNTAGVVRVTDAFATGVNVSQQGAIYAQVKSYEAYQTLHNNAFIGKQTLENVITGKGLVSNTDYATASTGGVIKFQRERGLQMTASGFLTPVEFAYPSDYTWRNRESFIAKGTLENIIAGREYHGTHTLTQTELDAQAAAGTLVEGDWYGVTGA